MYDIMDFSRNNCGSVLANSVLFILLEVYLKLTCFQLMGVHKKFSFFSFSFSVGFYCMYFVLVFKKFHFYVVRNIPITQ